jgi:photosystem II stability/assembly factor-like uncharacterized protein
MRSIGLALVIVISASACSSAGARTDSDAAKASDKAAPLSVRTLARPAVWIDSLQMTSTSTGWALILASNPNAGSALDLARTTDGARSWTIVTPPAARGSLTQGQALLDAASGQRAWVVGVTPSHESVIFGTANAGRSWWRSAPVAAAQPTAVDFAGPDRGWLLDSLGAAMGSNPVRVYRTTDGGLRWSLTARPQSFGQAPANSGGLPITCDKVGIAFSSPRAGWISTWCNLGYSILVSRDGGARWASQQLPIPQSACEQAGCDISEPQFAGRTTFLELTDYPDAPLLFVSLDSGASWRTVIMPGGAGPYPRMQFFTAAEGIAVSAGPQGSIGRNFYLTSDGGLTWTAVPQGRIFDRSGASFDFISPTAGLAWLPPGLSAQSAAPGMYRTSDSGHTWTSFVPRLS